MAQQPPAQWLSWSAISTLAIARDLQQRTDWSIKKIVRALRPLQHITIRLAGQQLQAEPAIPDDTAEMLRSLSTKSV